MARGRESKAVEAQQEMRDGPRKRSPAPPSPGERERLERRRTLERALRDLEVAWART